MIKNSAKAMYFHKWTGKKNSVFLSFHKQIKISVLSVAYFLLNAFSVGAQIDTIKIDEVNVSAYRTKVTFTNAPRMISIISADEIGAAPIVSINDALKSLMNIDVRERGAFGIQSDLNIRGGSFEQNAVLINGVRMNDPQTGHFQMNLPIDLNDIQRIEVLRGSSSSLLGNNALGGGINIITGLKTDNSAKVALLAGEHALFGLNLSLNLSSKIFKNYVSVSKKVSDGYIENTDFDILNLFYNSKLILNPGVFQFQAGFTDKAFGANSFYTPVYPNQFEQNKTGFANLSFTSNTKIKYSPSVYWRRNTDRFELFRDNPPVWYTSHNYHMTDVYGANINSSFNTFIGQSAIGVDWNVESILSNKLGELLNDTIAVRGEENGIYTRGKTRQNLSTYYENQLDFNKLRISARLMANWNSMFEWNFYPGIDAIFAAGEKFKIFGSANWSGRVPSYTELYYISKTDSGNINLKPEKAVTYELGTKYTGKHLFIQSAVFYRLSNNMIDWVKYTPQGLWVSSNITNVNTYGFDFSAKWDVQSQFGEESFIKSIGFNYSYVSMDKSVGEYVSKYVLDYLKHSADVSITHKIVKNLSAGWQFNLQDRNGTYLPYNTENKVFDPAQDYKPLFLLDLKLSYKYKFTEVFIQAKNILDQDQQNIENVRLPGRWISGGVSANLNWAAKNKNQNKPQ